MDGSCQLPSKKCHPTQEKAGSEGGSPFAQVPQLGAECGCRMSGKRLTWVVGKVLWLTSFPLSVDDVEVDFHGHADMLVPILRDLNKKHVLEGSSCHESDHM